MKITICGSIAAYNKMLEVKKELEMLGHQVDLPPAHVKNEQGQEISVAEFYQLRKNETSPDSWIWERKKEAMQNHFHKIEWCDAILVLNLEKNGIAGYIGANTFLEMGLALHLQKPIYLYNPIPQNISYFEEIMGCRPITLDQDLTKIG